MLHASSSCLNRAGSRPQRTQARPILGGSDAGLSHGRVPTASNRLGGLRPKAQAAATGAARPAAAGANTPGRGAFAPTAARAARALTVASAAAAAGPAATGAAEAFELASSKRHDEAELTVEVLKGSASDAYKVRVVCSPPKPGRVLHWAVNEWELPPKASWPQGTRQIDDKAVQTPFVDGQELTINFAADAVPGRVVFVLKDTQPQEAWLNSGGGDFTVQLRAPQLKDLIGKVLVAEGTYHNWSLMQRMQMVGEMIDALDAAGPEGMAFLYTWMRLSNQRLLDWYRNMAYQSKDMAHVQKHVTERVAEKARTAGGVFERMYARMAMGLLPRGGGNGDDIRMGILHIMRGYGIKEGHRPGLDEPFLEQWHQKLHTNTSPDDVAICEAYLAFLHSGNHDDYWRVLWERGQLSREKLASMDRPIKAAPLHLPYLIDAFKGFLWTLKVTHSGADLDTAAEMSKGFMDEGLRWDVFDLLSHRHEWWVPGKIVSIRSRLAQYWKVPGAPRDLLLLDLALDSWFRLSVEKVDKGALNGDDLLELCCLVLRNGTISVSCPDIGATADQWDWLRQQQPRWSRDWALAALAAAQRAELSLASHMDAIYSAVQPQAEAFAKACNIDPKHIANFGEEVVRGQPLFMLSLLLQQLVPKLRGAAQLGAWQVVSQGRTNPVTGSVMAVTSLADIQGQSFESQPRVLLAERVGGMEDIPQGVLAVLTRSTTDVLSHVAIRARSQGVLLATCFDDAEWAKIVSHHPEGQTVAVSITSGEDVHVVHAEAAAATPAAAPGVEEEEAAAAGAAARRVQLAQPLISRSWALSEADFGQGLVGAKALNLALVRSKLPEWIHVPRSVSLPFGSFERVLKQAANADAAAALEAAGARLAAAGTGAQASAILAEIRTLVQSGLEAPAPLVAELSEKAAAAGLIPSPETWTAEGSAAWKQAWSAICGVWASKWTERAWLSRRAHGVPDEELFMAVLLQQVVPSQYAYVLHTAHPVTGAAGEVFGEACCGMGEALVGSHPGRALSFSCSLADPAAQPQLHSLPSKRIALKAPAPSSASSALLIARSDANGEDLDEYAGAGLYDSIPFSPLEETPVHYALDALMTDPSFRAKLMQGLVDVGKACKAAFGGKEQDVEGCWVDGAFWVVQCRPQQALKADD